METKSRGGTFSLTSLPHRVCLGSRGMKEGATFLPQRHGHWERRATDSIQSDLLSQTRKLGPCLAWMLPPSGPVPQWLLRPSPEWSPHGPARSRADAEHPNSTCWSPDQTTPCQFFLRTLENESNTQYVSQAGPGHGPSAECRPGQLASLPGLQQQHCELPSSPGPGGSAGASQKVHKQPAEVTRKTAHAGDSLKPQENTP